MTAVIRAAGHPMAGVLTCFILTSGPKSAAQAAVGQWVAVTPPAFRSVLAPLIEHRQAEGFEVVVVEATEALISEHQDEPGSQPLQGRLNHLFQQHEGRKYLLLAGPVDPAASTKPVNTVVPGLRGKVGRMKGEPCDIGFGLPDLNGAPRVAVGRLPARNPDELGAMVRKTLNFENNRQPTPWGDRLLLLLGDPGGGPLAEMFVEQTLRKDLALVHPAWEVRTLFSARSSRYYLPPPLDHEAAMAYLRDGQLFSVYLGHSAADGMGLDAKFMTREDWARMNGPPGQGLFFTCGCFACQSGGAHREGYGLTALRNPAGPVAVIGATGESYSAPGQLAAEGLLSCLAQPPFPTRLGDYWLAIQGGLAHGQMDEASFALLDMADGTRGKVPLAIQRLEHLEMWMLLGDPAVRLPIVPIDISLAAPEAAVPGKDFKLEGILPDRLLNALVHITLERPLNSTPVGLERPPPVALENSEARLRAIANNHKRANLFILAEAEVQSVGGNFAASMTVPAELPWTNLILRASARVSWEKGLGILRLRVKTAAPYGSDGRSRLRWSDDSPAPCPQSLPAL